MEEVAVRLINDDIIKDIIMGIGSIVAITKYIFVKPTSDLNDRRDYIMKVLEKYQAVAFSKGPFGILLSDVDCNSNIVNTYLGEIHVKELFSLLNSLPPIIGDTFGPIEKSFFNKLLQNLKYAATHKLRETKTDVKMLVYYSPSSEWLMEDISTGIPIAIENLYELLSSEFYSIRLFNAFTLQSVFFYAKRKYHSHRFSKKLKKEKAEDIKAEKRKRRYFEKHMYDGYQLPSENQYPVDDQDDWQSEETESE